MLTRLNMRCVPILRERQLAEVEIEDVGGENVKILVKEIRFYLDEDSTSVCPRVYVKYDRLHEDDQGNFSKEKVERDISLLLIGNTEHKRVSDFAKDIIEKIEAL